MFQVDVGTGTDDWPRQHDPQVHIFEGAMEPPYAGGSVQNRGSTADAWLVRSEDLLADPVYLL